MPLTAATALIASLSISGVPLFNGFASKWTIYVATVQGSHQAGYLAVFAAIAILTSALTLASFVKFFGASFLSRSSALVKEKAAQNGLEVGTIMQIPQVLLAMICLLLGLVPAIAYGLIHNALLASPHGIGQALGAVAPAPASFWTGLSSGESTPCLFRWCCCRSCGWRFCWPGFIGTARPCPAPRRRAVALRLCARSRMQPLCGPRLLRRNQTLFSLAGRRARATA